MNSVIVTARVRPNPERRAELLALLEEVQDASRKDEGCVHYGYYADIADADSMIAVEEWRDMPALEAHLRQPHVAKLVEALPALIDGRPDIVAHQVSMDGPLPSARPGLRGVSADRRAAREALVREHMESENRHEFDATLATFDHPRYEIVPTGEVFDGPEEVMAYFETSRTAFPDQRNELIALHHAEDGVIAEFTLLGTHDGPLRGIPPTGKAFTCRCAAFFLFEDERLVCERVYFDAGTILAQLGLAPALPTA